MSGIFKASILLTVFFGINKVVALLRQWLTVSRFGLSPEIDAFNAANNLPDLVFSLFSGGALAIAFIPVFVEYIEEFGKSESWKLFSKTANFLFGITSILVLIIYVFAPFLVSWELGVAPGLSSEQQILVVELMRIDLVAILIFSVSGIVMASLQSHKHFLLPAVAPVLYNIGMIVGIIFLTPRFGIYGLAYGTIIGSLLHLIVQIPGLIRFEFKWHPVLDFKEESFKKILRLMIPRIFTIFLIQLTFLTKDNLASRLPTGSISALTYAYFIMQVPETLIGTAVATAILPSLSTMVSRKKRKKFIYIINKSIQIVAILSVVAGAVGAILITPLLETFFSFSRQQVNLISLTTLAFLFGLMGHSVLEILVRAYYAGQDAKTPLWATALRVLLFIVISVLTFRAFGAPAVAFADSVTVLIEVLILAYFLYKSSGKLPVARDS